MKQLPDLQQTKRPAHEVLGTWDDAGHRWQEFRFHALGKTHEGRRLHITFTLRQDDMLIRVISVRDMHRKERTIYEQAN